MSGGFDFDEELGRAELDDEQRAAREVRSGEVAPADGAMGKPMRAVGDQDAQRDDVRQRAARGLQARPHVLVDLHALGLEIADPDHLAGRVARRHPGEEDQIAGTHDQAVARGGREVREAGGFHEVSAHRVLA